MCSLLITMGHSLYPWQQRRLQTFSSALTAEQWTRKCTIQFSFRRMFIMKRSFSTCILTFTYKCIWSNTNSYKHSGCKENQTNHKSFQTNSQYYCAQLLTNPTTEQHYSGGSKAAKVSALPLSGAILSGDVGRAQIKAIPHRLKILQGGDQHSWMAATWSTLNEHWPHATYQRLPEAHITAGFILTQYMGHLSLGDCFVQARKIPDTPALRVLGCYAVLFTTSVLPAVVEHPHLFSRLHCEIWLKSDCIWEIWVLLMPLLLLF